MDTVLSSILPVLRGGLGNLAAYLAAHVLLCLLPAFFIAGAMAALIPKETITRFLGRNASKAVSYPAAAAAGSLLAVCSCTIVPLFAGIHKKGAGLGPAITFLFFAPAANILALVYTGGIIGPDLAIARFLLSLIFGIGIGLIMALLFRADDVAHDQATDSAFGAAGAQGMGRAALVFLLTWVALLLAGTLKLGVLTGSWFQFELPLSAAETWQAGLDQLVPFDAGKGEEGVSVQGVLLIGLLVAIGASAWRGIDRWRSGINIFTRMRYCDVRGRIGFGDKGAPGTQRPGLYPWFEVPGQIPRSLKIVCGHWSTLGRFAGLGVHAIDTGCVWGGWLTAMRLDVEEPEYVTIKSDRKPAPGKDMD